jgi:methylated-DNA-[protein]-cysteine S-methyltransferase
VTAMAESFRVVDSPLGPLLLAAERGALTMLWMSPLPDHDGLPGQDADRGVLSQAATQLDRYFDGGLTAFELPLAPRGTAFQRSVWSALVEIPFGETVSYGELAARIGRPGAARAVGLANGSNPISIIIPCHRVIGSDGRLTGYGGGIDRKAWLLDHEGVRRPQQLALPVAEPIAQT